MAIDHITYLDLTPEQRFAGAKKARERVQTALSSPLVTRDQVDAIQAHLAHLDRWEKGTIEVDSTRQELSAPTEAPLLEAPTPTSHEVTVSADVELFEDEGQDP